MIDSTGQDKYRSEMAKKEGLVVFAYGKPKNKQLRSRFSKAAR